MEWEWIERPTVGVAVTTADVIILRKEFERCEPAWGLFDANAADYGVRASTQAKRPAGPGAPPKHHWDACAGAIAQAAYTAGMLSRIPTGKFAPPEDVAEVILFLLTDALSMLNGLAMPVDGGFMSV